MARPSWLPARVYEYKDRHGKPRYKFVHGFTYHFKYPLGSPEFLAELTECRQRSEAPKVGNDRARPGTIDYLVASYFRSQDFNEQGETSRIKNRAVIEGFRKGRGDRLVRELRFEHLDAIIAKKGVKSVNDKGRMVGGRAAAQRLRKQLNRLFRHAVRIGMLTNNPVEHTSAVKYKSSGFHTWTEEELVQFQNHHPIGSKARLALEIMLWSGQRGRSDARLFGPEHVRGGRYQYTQQKTGKSIWLPMVPQLKAAIDAMPAIGLTTYLVNELGRPFTSAGFGNWFRDQCDTAGLPHCTAHGLRKAFARRLAENLATQQGIKAAGGWSNDREVAIYVAKANQAMLAEEAVRSLSQNFANPSR